MPGDYATVEADDTYNLLGRGSVCINTGGEKVYPEEVEEVLKEHAAVRDAVVVGVPDERFGEVIVAWVEPPTNGPTKGVDENDVIAHVKGRLASYKAPRRVFTTDNIGRSPAGKVDYRLLKSQAVDRLGQELLDGSKGRKGFMKPLLSVFAAVTMSTAAVVAVSATPAFAAVV